MTSEDLTIEQAQHMGAVVDPQLRYLNAVTRRMDLRRFDPTDPLYLDSPLCSGNRLLCVRHKVHKSNEGYEYAAIVQY